MPHITVIGCDRERQMQLVNIHVEIEFAEATYNDFRRRKYKMEEITNKLEKLLEEYFDHVESETYSNHQFNTEILNSKKRK